MMDTANARWIWLFGIVGLAACGSGEPPSSPEVVNTVESAPAADLMTMPHNELTEVQSADGVSIHFDQRGQGDIAVLLVHGWSCDSGYWQRQRDWLAERYRVISVDLAGHGKSGVNRTEWSMTAFGEDVAAVARALDLDNIVLVGHSMGGPVVLEAGRLLENRVIGVVGADTLRNIGQAMDPDLRAAYMKRIEEDFTTEVTGIVEGMFLEDADPGIRDFVIRDMASAPPQVGLAALVALNSYDAEGGLDRLTAPLVLINSDYRPNHLEPLEQRISDFQFVAMTGVGHFVMLEDPPTFNTHLESAIQHFIQATSE